MVGFRFRQPCGERYGAVIATSQVFDAFVLLGLRPVSRYDCGGLKFCEMNLMNYSAEMKKNDVLRVELEVFRREHRDLDNAIEALEASGRGDQLALRRLKKQKLVLKDRIAKIEDQLTPDIIA